MSKIPDKCPITGLKKCDTYTIEDNEVYVSIPPINEYTLPNYNPVTKEFHRFKYDTDIDTKELEYLCHLDDLKNREDYEIIKQFYGIVD